MGHTMSRNWMKSKHNFATISVKWTKTASQRKSKWPCLRQLSTLSAHSGANEADQNFFYDINLHLSPGQPWIECRLMSSSSQPRVTKFYILRMDPSFLFWDSMKSFFFVGVDKVDDSLFPSSSRRRLKNQCFLSALWAFRRSKSRCRASKVDQQI